MVLTRNNAKQYWRNRNTIVMIPRSQLFKILPYINFVRALRNPAFLANVNWCYLHSFIFIWKLHVVCRSSRYFHYLFHLKHSRSNCTFVSTWQYRNKLLQTGVLSHKRNFLFKWIQKDALARLIHPYKELFAPLVFYNISSKRHTMCVTTIETVFIVIAFKFQFVILELKVSK